MSKAPVEEIIAKNPNARATIKRKSYWQSQSNVEKLAQQIIEVYWYPELYGEAGVLAAIEEDKRLEEEMKLQLTQ